MYQNLLKKKKKEKLGYVLADLDTNLEENGYICSR